MPYLRCWLVAWRAGLAILVRGHFGAQSTAEGAVEEGGEEVLGLTQRLALHRTQVLHSLNYFPQKKRWWLRLREKNGKLNEMPCHHKLETFLDAFIDAGRRAGPQGAAVPSRDWQTRKARAGAHVPHGCVVHGAPPCF